MAKMIKRISIRLIKDESGAGMVEYALLVALIGVLLIATLVALAGGINGAFNTAITALGGTPAPAVVSPLAGP
ncbi:MAG: Flp family type IVb pilin [Proteobacteria bacterium]|nr:Flp family type IVb pilin [Pseudomonadota bacterium]